MWKFENVRMQENGQCIERPVFARRKRILEVSATIHVEASRLKRSGAVSQFKEI